MGGLAGSIALLIDQSLRKESSIIIDSLRVDDQS